MYLFAIGVFIGIFLPLQTAINSRFRERVVSPFLASTISFSVGTIFLGVLVIATHGILIPSSTLFLQQPIWIWLGGILGIVFLTGNILLFPHIGGVQTVIMPILGQILMSMIIDNFGLFSSTQHHLSLLRICGATLVFFGVIIAVALPKMLHKDKLTLASKNNESPLSLLSWCVFGVITGAFSATQTAINGHLCVILKSSVNAAFFSFLIGTIFLWIIVLFKDLKSLKNLGNKNIVWWNWSGGLLGAIFVTGNSFLVPQLGTGVVTVIVLIGMIIGSLLVDHFGLFQSPKHPIQASQIIGIIVMIIGVGIIKLL
ncbi:DMT family transporter [Liquorilactobacillus cacaonum]|uniref:Integral membrane protein n=1 Tax=Liquorilactobacillus cacaonum DSM 21116 TaxID=1423729 RepID=A0A0R2CNC4_9LACO|nr:DMT family transporter [Liquorilactobacillus cacaonum]KRM92762.1 hypothetical protein FC80_GL001701 [Liquorilactobacillus cacaonum DSM 21116]